MNARTTASFWKDYEGLPPDVKRTAKRAFATWRRDHYHPGLQFKPIKGKMWSARVSDNYRAVGLKMSDDEIVWIFIGTHDKYDRLIGR